MRFPNKILNITLNLILFGEEKISIFFILVAKWSFSRLWVISYGFDINILKNKISKLVLSWYIHQPELHQKSLSNVETPDRTPCTHPRIMFGFWRLMLILSPGMGAEEEDGQLQVPPLQGQNAENNVKND